MKSIEQTQREAMQSKKEFGEAWNKFIEPWVDQVKGAMPVKMTAYEAAWKAWQQAKEQTK